MRYEPITAPLSEFLIKKFIALLAVLVLSQFQIIGVLRGADPSDNETAELEIPVKEYLEHLKSGLQKVEQFEFIRQKAEEIGCRVYLFGGSAASFAHYVKQDWLRLHRKTAFFDSLFNYEFTNIYRANQDADLVVDGTVEQTEKLGEAILRKYPHLQGSKSNWDLRILDKSYNDRDAIFSDAFLNQHSDSHSVGLIEITEPPKNEVFVKDARDMKSKYPQFLKDVLSGTLHFYFSDTHEETERFKKGRNPPLFSVIRYFTKAFQHELEIPEEDAKVIKNMIEKLPNREEMRSKHQFYHSQYIFQWLSRNIPKLTQNAVNVEYANDTLKRFKLNDYLFTVGGQVDLREPLYWISREALPTQSLGEKGRSAQELGISIVAHEAADYQAYESITRSRRGHPNAFISRKDNPREAALHGNGFYTRMGTKGARNTGFHIRFKVHPDAREGVDFDVFGDYVLFYNKAALEVIPENWDTTAFQYIMLLRMQNIGKDERGIIEKLKYKFSIKSKSGQPLFSKDELSAIVDLIALDSDSNSEKKAYVGEFLRLLETDPSNAHSTFEFIDNNLSKLLLDKISQVKSPGESMRISDTISSILKYSPLEILPNLFKIFIHIADARTLERLIVSERAIDSSFLEKIAAEVFHIFQTREAFYRQGLKNSKSIKSRFFLEPFVLTEQRSNAFTDITEENIEPRFTSLYSSFIRFIGIPLAIKLYKSMKLAKSSYQFSLLESIHTDKNKSNLDSIMEFFLENFESMPEKDQTYAIRNIFSKNEFQEKFDFLVRVFIKTKPQISLSIWYDQSVAAFNHLAVAAIIKPDPSHLEVAISHLFSDPTLAIPEWEPVRQSSLLPTFEERVVSLAKGSPEICGQVIRLIFQTKPRLSRSSNTH